jgi:hypothetical protein
MHPNQMFQRLTKAIADAEARTLARLDRIEAKVDEIRQAAGLVVEPLPVIDEPGSTSPDTIDTSEPATCQI